MTKSDAQLLADIGDELRFDPSIDSSKVQIGVHDGVATLSGSVPSYWQKIEAEKAVRRVAGVRGIANDLTVDIPGVYHRDDADIARTAANVLQWHSDLPKDIKVTVSNGWITLTGTVDWNYQKEEAERAVRYLSGVKAVINEISIRELPKPTDIKERIKQELERIVDQEAAKIQVDASDGRVTLKGTVHSWSEREAARHAAYSAPGVREVENLLTVA